MSQALIKAVANCSIQYETKGQLRLMQPIACTELMELVHIDYVGMEVTAKEKPMAKNVLVVVDHLHAVRPGICDEKSCGKNNCSSAVQQLLFSFWLPAAPHVRSRYQILWECDCSHVQPTGC